MPIGSLKVEVVMGYDGAKMHNEPEKCEECEACKTTHALRNIMRAAQGCNAATRLNPSWVISECKIGIGIKFAKPRKFS